MYIGIDFGLKRCGIAVTDTESIIASPLQMVPSEKLLSWLKEFAAKHSIAGFVLGYPLNLDGSKTHVSDNVTLLKEVIEKEFSAIPVYLQDERYSSKRASEAIYMAGKKKDLKNKALVDTVSAAIILQDFLNSR